MAPKNIEKVTIYTDGCCLGNPGRGGWGAIVEVGGVPEELSGGFRLTTNNRMELMAVIEALKALKNPCKVRLYSDSQYFCNAVNKGWLRKWKNNGWRGTKGNVANVDLWQIFLRVSEPHDLSVIWVKGHNDNPGNERCDRLANAAAAHSDLPSDVFYETASS